MLNEQEKRILSKTLEADFPHVSDEAEVYMYSILDDAFACAQLLSGERPSAAKAKAIVAQLKSFLQILGME